jgi:hypothetical protein
MAGLRGTQGLPATQETQGITVRLVLAAQEETQVIRETPAIPAIKADQAQAVTVVLVVVP